MRQPDDELDAEGPGTMVLVRSASIRMMMISELERAGIPVTPAVGFEDAARIMRTRGTPDAFVIGEKLGPQESGVRLARNLARLEATCTLPAVVLVRGEDTEQEVDSLPCHVRSVRQQHPLKDTARRILEQHTEAAVRAKEAEASRPRRDKAPTRSGKQRVITSLDAAYELFDEVVTRVKKDELPGPLVPGLLEKVQALAADPKVDFGKISDFIRQHQTLSARLLALANSAMFSRGERAKTVEQAVSRLGLKTTNSQLRMLAMREYVVGGDPRLREQMEINLQTASLVGLVAARLAKAVGADPYEAETLGLFHNIGAVFLYYTFGLLLDEGKVDAVDMDALKTMTRSRARSLNDLVRRGMGLPAELDRLYAEPAHETTSPLLRVVHQSMWIAQRALEDGEVWIEHDDEAEILGIDGQQLDLINCDLPNLLGLVKLH